MGAREVAAVATATFPRLALDGTRSTEDEPLTQETRSLVQSARRVLQAHEVEAALRGVGAVMSPRSPDSSLSGIGELLGGVGRALESASSIQTKALTTLLEQTQGKGQGQDQSTTLLVAVLVQLFQTMQQQMAKSQQDPLESPVVKFLLERMDREIQELKGRGQDPVSEQFQQLMAQMAIQNLQHLADPTKALDREEQLLQQEARIRDLRRRLLGHGDGADGDLTPSRLRAKELEFEHQARVLELQDKREARESTQRFWSQTLPTAAAALGQSIAQALAQFGLVPTGTTAAGSQALTARATEAAQLLDAAGVQA